MSILGALNGTDVYIRVYDITSGLWHQLSGEMSNSVTANNGAIDITSKTDKGFRCLMAAEGLKTTDVTAEAVFNSSEGFEYIRQSYLSQSIEQYQIVKADETDPTADNYLFYITSWAETAPDNDKLTASISMQSSGAPTYDLQIADLSGIPAVITGSTDAGYDINADLTHESIIDAVPALFSPNWLPSGLGTDYEVQLSVTSTDTTVGGDAVDVWIDLNVDPTGNWLITGAGFAEVVLLIREKTKQIIIATKAFRIEVV